MNKGWFKEEELQEAKAFAQLCYEGKRWLGIPLLMIIDACFDSIGLNYFTVVFRKTKLFYDNYVKTGIITNCKDYLAKKGDQQVRQLINNDRVINCISEICKIVARSEDEFSWLKRWAENANPYRLKEDIIGKIKGIGISTFQYLRMQVGVDTIMPDKVIIKWLNEKAGLNIKSPEEAIEKGHKFAQKIGIRDTELCWAIWIAESHELGKIIVM